MSPSMTNPRRPLRGLFPFVSTVLAAVFVVVTVGMSSHHEAELEAHDADINHKLGLIITELCRHQDVLNPGKPLNAACAKPVLD